MVANDKEKSKHKNDDVGREKNITTIKPSLLSELTQLPHLWCMYNFAVAIFILVWMRASFFEFAHKGRFNLGWRLIFIGFGQLGTVILSWCYLLLLVLSVYPLVKFWATGIHQTQGTAFQSSWKLGCVISYILFQLIFITTGVYSQTSHMLPIVSSLVILLETMRLTMKIHAFVRSTSEKIAKGCTVPPFSNYLYFLFAPTLIYRDSYPRTKDIRWSVVFQNLLEVVMCSLFISCLCEIFSVNYFSKIGTPQGGVRIMQLFHNLFDASLGATLSFVYSFYLLLHSWQNMFAELLCFANRQFYDDWWAQGNYKTFYTRINSLLFDWLNTYIYADLLIVTKSKRFASAVIFLLPAIIYQAIFSLTLGSFLPVLLIFYIVMGVLGTFIDDVCGNLFVWTTLATGNGILWILFSIEYYARINCPNTNSSFLYDFFFPRILTCDNVVFGNYN